MNKNLLKRIFTSVVLLTLLFVCLFFNKYSWLFLLIIASIICFSEFNSLTKKIWKKKKLSIYLSNLTSFFYLIFFIYSAYNFAKIEIIIVLLVCIFSDIGGYMVGKSVGGKKLTKISPNKTISGSIGSFSLSLIPIICFFYFENFDVFQLNLVNLIIFILLISFICQVGDLFISYFKRKANVKDTGTLLPGHGGLLDRIDGVIFAVPGAFLLDKIIF
tara:strand:- start:1225 stop:1875 length:651 start_codon:yes stop_codon:yes gene_type:complete